MDDEPSQLVVNTVSLPDASGDLYALLVSFQEVSVAKQRKAVATTDTTD